MTISLNDEVQRAPLMTLPKAGEKPQTDEFNATQATKLHLTLGDKSPGEDAIASQMSIGNATEYKRLLADRDALNRIQTQNDILDTIMKTDPTQITPEAVQTVHGLSMLDLQSPDLSSIIEKKYATLYTNTALAASGNDILDNAMATNPEAAHQMIDRSEEMIFKKNYAVQVLDQISKEQQDRPVIDKVWDFGESLVPGLGQYQKYNAVKMEDFSSSILPSNNRADQYAYLWSLKDPQEFKDTLDAAVQELKSRNLSGAEEWLQGLFSFGSSDQAFDNITTGIDVGAFVPIGRLGSLLKGVIKGGARAPTAIGEIASDMGELADTGTARVIDDLKDGSFAGQNIRNLDKVEQSTPSIMAPEALLKGAEVRGQAFANRLKEAVVENSDAAKKFLSEPNKIDRATPEELVNYKDDLMAEYKRNHPSIQKNVIDVQIDPEADLGNVYRARVVIGRADGSLFESEKQATNYAKRYIKMTDDFSVRQVGEGFQIEILKNVDETKFFDMKLGTSQVAPSTFGETFSGWWRSPNYTVSRENELARSTAVTSTERLGEVFSTMSEPITRLSKADYAELEDLLVLNTKGQFYYKNYGDFEKGFYERFKKNPTIEQAQAYTSYVQINDLDLWVRDLDVYKQKARLGIQNVTAKIDGKASSFEGKIIDRLPYESKDRFSVSIVKDGKASKPNWFVTKALREQIDKLLTEKNYKIIHVANGDLKVGESRPTFLITNDFKADRIGLGNVPRREGGHKVHKYPFYIKQGKITSNGESSFYRGDLTLFNLKTEKEAREALQLLEVARQKALRHDPDTTEFIRDNLPITPKEFFAAVAKGDINLSVPFAVTKRGASTIETGAYHALPNLVDLSKNEHNLSSQVMGRYLGARDQVDINLLKSEEDLKFEIEGAPYLSPLDTLRMSSANMMNVSVMNDYMIKTNQDFLREFGDILKGSPAEQRSSGISLLQAPEFKEGVKDEVRKARAVNVSRAYNHLMNQRTPFEDKINAVKDRFLESIYPRKEGRLQQIVENKMLGRVKDPGQFFRSVAFDFKLGLFNPQQYVVQANQMVNVFAVAGTKGLRGGLMYPITRAVLLSSSDAVLKGAAKKVEALGLMKAKDYEEAINLLKKSGFDHVGGDVAQLDELKAPELRSSAVGGAVKKTLAWGRTPFQEGEKVARLSGWVAAYLERREALGTKAMTRRDEAIILQRTKDLTGNMTRESNAAWQKGYGAVFTQFFGYQARIMEQMLGKKLTAAEKTRLFVGYSAVYGVPTAMGAVAGIVPVRDMIRDYMASTGQETTSPAAEAFMDGLAAPMIQMITGTELNVSARLGPGGLPTLYDMIRGDKTFADIMLGASGSIMADTVTSSIPALKAMYSEFTDQDGSPMNLQPTDFLAPLRNITTVDSLVKLYQVYNFGIWASKNGADITKMDLPDAVVAALTGLQPSRIEDIFTSVRGMESFKDWKQSKQKEFIKRYRQIMKMEAGDTRIKMTKDLKAEAETVFAGDIHMMAQTWRYALDNEMMDDSVFDQYQKIGSQMQAVEAAKAQK